MFNVFFVHCLFFLLLCAATSLPVKCHPTHTHVLTTPVLVLCSCVVFCSHLVCSSHPCHTVGPHCTSYAPQCLLPCYICPHRPCYMSALFSTSYWSVSTIQHIHRAYMYILHTYIHLLSVVCYITKKQKRAPWCRRFTCTR